MQRFKNILFYSQGDVDQPALERAARLAAGNEACLTIVEVMQDLPEELGMAPGLRPDDLEVDFTEERQDQLRQSIAPHMDDASRIRTSVLVGTPFLEITRVVMRDRHDLVMMAAEGPLGLKNILFGSTSMHLMRKCPCPVWVIKPVPQHATRRILAAVAPDPFNPERDALNATIIELAGSLAEQEQAELHTVHAWDVDSGPHMRRPSRMSRAKQEEWHRKVHEHSKTALFDLLGAYEKDLPGRAHLVKGRPGDLIPKLAAELEIDLVVMGTVCRTGVPGFFMGNTAESILQQIECSVLTVKPAGFVTPVT